MRFNFSCGPKLQWIQSTKMVLRPKFNEEFESGAYFEVQHVFACLEYDYADFGLKFWVH